MKLRLIALPILAAGGITTGTQMAAAMSIFVMAILASGIVGGDMRARFRWGLAGFDRFCYRACAA
jgi:hypothetical protein